MSKQLCSQQLPTVTIGGDTHVQFSRSGIIDLVIPHGLFDRNWTEASFAGLGVS